MDRGDIGMTAELVLKAAILKFIRCLSYRGLAFNIADSVSSRAFLGLELGEVYKHSTLQENISRISEESWKLISAILVSDAQAQKIESCKQVRIDSTTTNSHIHHPTDASLLYDCIRVIAREFNRSRKRAMKKSWRLISCRDVKRAKTLLYKINNSKNDTERLPYYKELLRIANNLSKSLPATINKIKKVCSKRRGFDKDLERLQDVSFHLVKIIYQTQKRVIEGKKFPVLERSYPFLNPIRTLLLRDKEIRCLDIRSF